MRKQMEDDWREIGKWLRQMDIDKGVEPISDEELEEIVQRIVNRKLGTPKEP